jgi:hypothetical protein
MDRNAVLDSVGKKVHNSGILLISMPDIPEDTTSKVLHQGLNNSTYNLALHNRPVETGARVVVRRLERGILEKGFVLVLVGWVAYMCF